MKILLRSILVPIVLLLALRAKATTWSDALVGTGGEPVMSATIGTDGFAQLVWISLTDGTLNYAYQDGSGFHTVSFTAANIGVSGLTATGAGGLQLGIAVDSNNVPHLAFGVSEAGGVSGARGVWYGTYGGTGSILSASNWTFQRVAAYTNPSGWLNVYTAAIAIDPTVNRPAVAWFLSDSESPRSSTIYYSTRASNGSWPGAGSLITTTNPTPPAPPSGMVIMTQYTGNQGDDVYGGLSFAISSNGKHAFTCPALDPSTGVWNQLLAGTDISGSWVTSTLQSVSNTSPSSLTFSPAVAFDPNNLPRVVWGDFRDNSTNLETTPNGTSWTNTVVMTALQSASPYGVGVSYAINSGFVELIASEESTMADGTAPWVIRTATRSGGSGAWTVQTAVATSDPDVLGYEFAAAVDSSNNAIIGYDFGEDGNAAGSVRLLTGVISFGLVPTVTVVSPNGGSTAGSTSVTLTGTNFTVTTAVNFGTTLGTGLTVNGPTSITVTSPAGTAGTVDITVTNTVGTSSAVTADHFTYEAVPTVTGLSVSSGPLTGATSVTLTGTGFIGATAVLFGPTNGTGVVVNSSTSITVVAPSGTAGIVDVTVVAPGGTSLTSIADDYTYVAPPTVTGLSITSGPLAAGTVVTLSGTNFLNATAVDFGSAAATGVSITNAMSITATSPAGLAGTVDVTVTTAGGRSATGSPDNFTYVAAPVFSSGTTATGIYGGTYTGSTLYAAVASNSPVYSLSSGSLPGGLSLDPTTGDLTGTPTQTGSFPVTFSASNAGGSPTLGVTISIGKAAATVTLSNLTATYDGTPKSVTATPSVNGLAVAVTYNGSSTVPTTAATYPVIATIVDPNYMGSVSNSLVIGKASTSVSWATPAAISYNTALSSAQLDATANAAGGFIYTPPSGTVLGPGPQTLDVTFTPTDSIDYTGSTGTVPLTVNPANAPIVLGNLTPTYDGTAKSATATTTPPGLTVTFTYAGSSTPPSAAGAYAVVATVNTVNYTGTANAILEIGMAPGTVNLGSLTPTYDGTPKSATATTNPAGLAVTFTYNGSATLPTAAGTYAVVGTINDPNFQGSSSGALTIQRAGQTILFPAPAPGNVGVAIGLSASASSGLPVTYAVMGGATLSGNTVTLLDANLVTLTASQAGNANYLAAAPVVQTISASSKLAQTITVGALPNNASSAKSFTLNSTASSGLPVTYAVASGPAMISGSTVTPTGPSGTVMIVVSQPGDASYAAAPSLNISIAIIGSGSRQFFGTFVVTTASDFVGGLHPEATLTGAIAVSVNASNTSGTLLGTVGGSAFVVDLTIAADGSFTGATTAITAPGSVVTGPLTFSGTLSGNTLSGTIAEINASFSTAADPAAGISSPVAGFYQGNSLDSATGSTYSVVGTQGEVLVVVVTPTVVTSGTGAVAADGTFTVQTPQAITISGNIDPTTTTVVGTVTLPTGGTTLFSGLSGSTTRTDRLINLSSRGSVAGPNILISGLVIGGSADKTLLLRAVGPGLSAFGVPGVLAQPRLQLLDSTGAVISDSAGWGGSSLLQAAFARVGAFPLVATSADAAILTTLAPGQYTLQVSNAGTDAGGIALAEIYDADANPTAEYQRLINISTRAFVGSGASALTGGFIIAGNDPKNLLIRAVGPGLAPFGVANTLSNPLLTVYDSTGAVIAQNDDWGTPIAISAGQVAASSADIIAAELATGAFALSPGSEDSALIITLPPGAYTAQVSGVGGTTGTALVEIYEIPTN